jgi:hypothetical protein
VREEPVATNDRLLSEVSTPTLANGLVLGAGPGLICLDPNDGLKLVWKNTSERALRGDLHIVVTGKHALVFNTKGYVVLLAVKPDGVEILGKEKLCEATLMHPAVAMGRVYIRDAEHIYCYDLRAPGTQ